MVLVRVADHDARELVLALQQVADIGQDAIDSGQIVSEAEGDADVDCKPLPIAPVPVAVEGEVHADLADAAERHEDEFVRAHQGPAVAAAPK